MNALGQDLQAQFEAATKVSSDDLRINTAAELFAAISSGDMLTRISVLEAIALDPQGALGLGSDGDTDLTEVLCEALEQSFGSELRLYVIAALSAMPSDARVRHKMEQVWFLSDDTNERLMAVSRLAQDADPAVRSHLQTTLLSNDPDRAQAVANVWPDLSEDSPQLQLRLALSAEQWLGVVPTLQDNPNLWLSELRGPFAEQARGLLETDPRAAQLLAACWEQLSRDNRAWLLGLATRLGSPELSHLTDLALRDEALHLGAIQATQSFPEQYAEQLQQLADHSPDPVVQAAAIQAGAPGDNRFRAVKAAVRTVRVAAIRKLALRDSDALLELLHDPDWRIRSAAADRLVELGESGKQAVLPLLGHGRLEVRMAAARVVYE